MSKTIWEKRFEKFDRANPHVWELFVDFTMRVIRRGRTNYTVRAIMDRIRWHTEIEVEGGGQWKLNENFAPYYGRKFMRQFPKHQGFFRTRKLRAAEAE